MERKNFVNVAFRNETNAYREKRLIGLDGEILESSKEKKILVEEKKIIL